MPTCILRDGTVHELPGPPNCANGDHVATFRFSLSGGHSEVTFRKFGDSDRYGEVSSRKAGVEP
jgi:hypothetical protein